MERSMGDSTDKMSATQPAKKAWTGPKAIEKLPVVDHTAGLKPEWFLEFSFGGFVVRDFRTS